MRWGQKHPDQDVDLDAPPHIPEPEDEVPNRHSASAEAAALRWHERHPDDEVPNRHSASAEAASLRWRERHADSDE